MRVGGWAAIHAGLSSPPRIAAEARRAETRPRERASLEGCIRDCARRISDPSASDALVDHRLPGDGLGRGDMRPFEFFDGMDPFHAICYIPHNRYISTIRTY